MTAWEALHQAEPRLGMREAGLLLAAAWGMKDGRDVWLAGGSELPPEVLARFRANVRRRAAGEPYAYITGRAHFWNLELRVNSSVLCPRPETEHLVEAILRLDLPAGSTIADIGTGSGAVALAVKSERPDLAVVATDASRDALGVAADNARRLRLDVRFLWGDLLGPLATHRITPDVVAMNPPYVASRDEVSPELAFEPAGALRGGRDGLTCYRHLADGAAALLPAGGYLVLEVGAGQTEAAKRIVARRMATSRATVDQDLAGYDRVVTFRRSA